MAIITTVISKTDETISFDIGPIVGTPTCPAESVLHLGMYGLTQWLADAHANVKRSNFPTDEAFIAAVNKPVHARVEQLRTGKVPTAKVVDPKTLAMRQMAAQLLAAGFTGPDDPRLVALLAAPTAAPIEAPIAAPVEIPPGPATLVAPVEPEHKGRRVHRA